jgi:hypothetical protein
MAQGDLLQRVRMAEVDVRTTSGTLLTQRIQAETGRMNPDGSVLVGEGVVMMMRADEEAGEVVVTAPLMRYRLTGTDVGELAPPRTPPHAEVAGWYQALWVERDPAGIREPHKGDLVLFDPEGLSQVRVAYAEGGRFECSVFYLARVFDQVVALGPFEQNVAADGGRLSITCHGFATDRRFQQSMYYVLDDQPVVIEYSGDSQ